MFSFLKDLEEFLNTGDPTFREWFLIKTNFWPFFLSSMYLLIIKVIGPSYMKNRKPFELRNVMVCYNAFLVVSYTYSIYLILDCVVQNGFLYLCGPLAVRPGNCAYRMGTAAWIIYLLKYLEFLDTIFFVMRQKYKMITNLHVIHHTLLPLIGWILFRTETSSFMAYPVLINSFIHVIMYSYYGLAALGPGMQKYLWWKKYLTIAQMVQFVLILVFNVVLKPFFGCTTAKSSHVLCLTFATLFLFLFYNFYKKSYYKKTVDIAASNGLAKETIIVDGKVVNKKD